MIKLELAINGEMETVTVGATQTLLDVVRSNLGLTGTKPGCNQGVCGSCTVLIDGKPARSCLVLAAGCRDKAITTIEGVGSSGAVSVVQQAFIDAGAVQCGYCTPGMVLAAEALLKRNKHPAISEIRDALSGNLCRCSGYTKIVDAVALASRKESP